MTELTARELVLLGAAVRGAVVDRADEAANRFCNRGSLERSAAFADQLADEVFDDDIGREFLIMLDELGFALERKP